MHVPRICREVITRCSKFAREKILFDVTMVDFSGDVLGRVKQEHRA